MPFWRSFTWVSTMAAKRGRGFDCDAMNRLYAKGMISNPVSKTKSLMFTEDGGRRAEQLCRECSAADDRSGSSPQRRSLTYLAAEGATVDAAFNTSSITCVCQSK
jgi:Domain of unknown function (DUF6429)